MKIIKILLLILSCSLFLIPYSSATEDITLTLEQKEYYFKTGETAALTLGTKNTYEKNISGQLSTAITQETNQQGIHQSSTSANSIPIKVLTGENKLGITFGTSQSQTTLDVKLSFEYYEEESRAVNMENIKIHFVQDESQQQNQQDQQQSSSESQASQQQKQLQDQMEKMQQENQQQQTPQKLANSQKTQDSGALKQQMQQQAQEQAQAKEEFKNSLEQNQQLQQEHQKMLDQGYQMKDMEMNPTENNSGDFKMNYEKPSGNQAQISGEMENNELKNLQTSTSEEKQQALEQLQQNENFQKMSEQLQKENFSPKDPQITKENNQTKIKMEYTNEKNQTATITAKIENQAVQEVKLEKENSFNFWNWMLIILALTVLILISIKIYQKYNPKKEEVMLQTKKTKPYNYKAASRKLLKKSKKLFEQKQYKDAYEYSSQAIRLYLSHKNSLAKETTNDEIIKHLNHQGKNTSKLKNILDLCALVEFAKYSPNSKDFNKITTFAEKLIK